MDNSSVAFELRPSDLHKVEHELKLIQVKWYGVKAEDISTVTRKQELFTDNERLRELQAVALLLKLGYTISK